MNFNTYYQRSMSYFSRHVLLGNTAHAAAGFGLAIVLQHHIMGNSFLPFWIGWICIIFSVMVHVLSVIKK